MDANRLVPVEVVVAAIIAFVMGLAKAMIYPDRRSVVGFVSAVVVGVLCGTVAGFISGEWGVSAGSQYFLSALFAIVGDRVIFFLLSKSFGSVVVNNDNRMTNVDYISGGVTLQEENIGSQSNVDGGVTGDANFVDGNQNNARREKRRKP